MPRATIRRVTSPRFLPANTPRRGIRALAAAALLAALTLGPAGAHEFKLGELVIGHPWSRPTAPGMPVGVAYLSITNRGARPDALVSARSPVAAGVEFHETRIAAGMARMRPLNEVVVKPGETVKLEPNGIHIMLTGLRAPLAAGTRVPLELTFRVAGKVTVQLAVETEAAAPAVGKPAAR